MAWRYLRWSLALLVVLGSFIRQGEAADIDLFAGPAPTGTAAPYLLFVIDTGASFSANNATFRCNIDNSGVVKTDGTGSNSNNTLLDKTNGGVEQCALYSVISSLPVSTTTVNIGVMFFNSGMKTFNPLDNTFSQKCVNGIGGCLGMPIVPINADTKPRILDWIRKWDISGNTNYNIKAPANRGDGATMQEAWAYYFGKTGISGRDYANDMPSAGCSSKNIVFIGNAFEQQASPKDATNTASPADALKGLSAVIGKRANPAATAEEKNAILDTVNFMCQTASKTTTLDGNEGKGAYALNWARYMKGQGVTTYSIGIVGPLCDAYYTGQLLKMGSVEVGGGKYFPTSDFNGLKLALGNIISEIQSVNSVFASVSLPVSVNTQGSYLNQVYIGMFRPDKDSNPRWKGNLKQYKLAKINNVLNLADADDAAALNNSTGFITECARSYWTPNTVDDYWLLDKNGGCLTVANSKASNYPDGNIVEKGAQAFVLRQLTPANRNVKTCSTTFGSCTTLTNFSTANSNVTAALPNDVINWARGSNVDDELDKGTGVMRPSIHGDVLHSRPMPINYGTDASPSIAVFYGGNDGMLRAVNGNRTSTFVVGANTYAAGAELWSFMPPEFFPSISRLKSNTLTISYPGSVGGQAKDYGMDGPMTAHIDSSVKYLYAPMRRGGRALYAFNVTTADSPSLLWKKGCPNLSNDTNCVNDASGDFRGMGQTWSSAKPMFTQSTGTQTLVITGGGYDACEDSDSGTVGGKNHNCTSIGTKGNKVYVLDGATGSIVKTFDTTRAVVADVTLVRDSTGKTLHGYTADLGGNVYRLAFGNGAPASWSITKIASLGCATPSACTDSVANRKFMFAPSVVTVDNSVYYIMLGSGDREKPLESYAGARSVTNYFFAFKDKPSDNTWLNSENATCGANVICLASLLGITTDATPSDSDLAAKKGWYLGLRAGEQTVTSALTIYGAVSFSTHKPAVYAANACTANLGDTRIYTVNYTNANSANGTAQRWEHVSGDGLPPSPVGGKVKLDDGSVVNFCISCSKDGGIGVREPGGAGGDLVPKGRIYWFTQK